MTVQEATVIVYMLHTNYPQDKKATEKELLARINLYAVEFADYDADIVRQAALHWMRTNKWMPTEADLLEACSRARMLAQVPVEQPKRLTAQAVSAWDDERLEAFCRSIGFGYSDDPEDEGWLPYEE
jgi:hypothetical protein